MMHWEGMRRGLQEEADGGVCCREEACGMFT